MCGIIGFIGLSKNPTKTYELATNLLRETQTRGTDATGFYCVSPNGEIDWHKKDIPAAAFVRTQAWKKQCGNAIALIGHARATTHGPETNNINNHPHISDNYDLAIVHNGVISGYQSIARKENIQLKGQCDSEILLRLIETEQDAVTGIKKIYDDLSSGYCGMMACLAIDFRENSPYFYAFRNSAPIHFVDLREELGQIFFFSTPSIWKMAVNTAGMNKNIQNAKINEVPSYEIWKFDTKNINVLERTQIEKPTYTNNLSPYYTQGLAEKNEKIKSIRETVDDAQQILTEFNMELGLKPWQFTITEIDTLLEDVEEIRSISERIDAKLKDNDIWNGDIYD